MFPVFRMWSKEDPCNYCTIYILNTILTEAVKSIIVLGVMVDKTLSWCSQIKWVCSR